MDNKHLLIDARAKLTWGEPPEQVLKFLLDAHIGEKQAAEVMALLMRERAAVVREVGRGKVISGLLLIAIPVVTFGVYLYLGFMFDKVMALAAVAGLVGAWRLMDGAMMILAPKSQKGDLSKLGE